MESLDEDPYSLAHDWLFEGLLRPLTDPVQLPLVIGAVARSLGEGDDEDRLLVRTLLSLDDPRRDRVFVDGAQGGHPRPLRALLRTLHERGYDVHQQGLAPWSRGLRAHVTDAFGVSPAEFVQRCMPHYHGCPNAWTDEHLAREHFASWDRPTQVRFMNEFLLYADALGRLEASPLGDAAAWLMARRKYVMRWTFVWGDVPLPREYAPEDVEAALVEALTAALDGVRRAAPGGGMAAVLEETLSRLYAPDATVFPLVELLDRAQCDVRWRRPILVWHTLDALVASAAPGNDEPPWTELRRTIDDAARWLW